MKLRNVFLSLMLLVLIYFSMVKPNKLLKPFFSVKDFLFSTIHVDSPKIIISNDQEESIIDNLKEELEILQKQNSIDLSISNYDMINATIVSRNKEYWFNTLTINKGKNDGIDIDMAVIDSNGLIGRISMVSNNTSTVKLITTNDTKNKISAVIHNREDDIYGIISGYDSKNNLLDLVISDNIKIEKGSKVETTGMGGVFPRGILIGKVYDLIKKEDNVTNIVRVIPSSNIEGERYVGVLLRKKISIN